MQRTMEEDRRIMSLHVEENTRKCFFFRALLAVNVHANQVMMNNRPEEVLLPALQ